MDGNRMRIRNSVSRYLVGGRDLGWAKEFMGDCASRIHNRVQITTDGHKAYLEAVENAFGADIDYAQLQKIYGAVAEHETRYSPARCIGCDMKVVSGDPDPKHVSTSFVERQNLSMRMSIRRFTRLTNAFSKKIENHAAAVAIWFMYYNFCRVHQTLRVTPALESGIADHVWSIEEMCSLLPTDDSATKRIDKALSSEGTGRRRLSADGCPVLTLCGGCCPDVMNTPTSFPLTRHRVRNIVPSN